MTNLHRILEPEVMDTLEEAFEYDSMDHSQVNEVFCNDFFAARNLTAFRFLMLAQAPPKSP